MLVAKTAATPSAMAMLVRQVRSRRAAKFRQARLYNERIDRIVQQSPPFLHHPCLKRARSVYTHEPEAQARLKVL